MKNEMLIQTMSLQEETSVNGGNPVVDIGLKILKFIGESIIGESITNPGAVADAFQSGMNKVAEKCQ